MYQVALSILRDPGLAEDAVQEAFMKLMKSDAFFADAWSDDCKRYMITVIKHASINIYNKKKREAEGVHACDVEIHNSAYECGTLDNHILSYEYSRSA